jgi:hypothetical protein
VKKRGRGERKQLSSSGAELEVVKHIVSSEMTWGTVKGTGSSPGRMRWTSEATTFLVNDGVDEKSHERAGKGRLDDARSREDHSIKTTSRIEESI